MLILGGRARRTEFWMWQLFSLIFTFLIFFCLGLISLQFESNDDTVNITIGLLIFLWFIAMILPSVALSVRRLHDTGNSGWMLLISIIPLIGPIWLFVLYVTNSQLIENKWEPNPKLIK